jgi:hypothetical protein
MDWSKYPRVKKIMDETGMTLDQAFIWIEQELEKRVR